MIETSELSMEKFTNVNNDTFELLYFILNDLVQMIFLKLDSPGTTNQNHFLLEDDFNLLDPVLLQHSMASPFSSYSQNDKKRSIEVFNRKFHVLEDTNYIREYLKIIESKAESLIPPDKIRLVSSINENSKYLSGIQFNSRKLNRFEVIGMIETQLKQLKHDLDNNKKLLESVNLTISVK